VALLAMQGRQSEAAGRLQTVIKHADPAVQKKITDAVNNIKPVTINGRVADSSTLDKSKQHNDWITNTFIPWVQSLLGKQGVAEGLSQNQGQVRQTLNAWMNQDQQYEDPSQRAGFQAKVWPYIQKIYNRYYPTKVKKAMAIILRHLMRLGY
jgi:hypothetical protein